MTEKNLLKAFAGESQAKNRYEFAAKVAKEEGDCSAGTATRKIF
jgi:rubrerythrin